MKLYDSVGNEILARDYAGTSLNELARSAEVLVRRKQGQFRLTPVLFWGAWALDGLSYVLGLFFLGTGILTGAISLIFFGVMLLIVGVVGVVVLYGGYYHKFGIPLNYKEEPKEFYCKSCEAKIEKDLEIANQERLQEAVALIERMTGEEVTFGSNQLESPKQR